METVTSFQSNWNPFFYNLLDAPVDAPQHHHSASDFYQSAHSNRSQATSALSFVFDSAGEGSPQPSQTSPIRFGAFSSMSMLNGNASSNHHVHFAPNCKTESIVSDLGNGNGATPSSGFVASDEEMGGNVGADDDVFLPSESSADDSGDQDNWKNWNIQTAPGCPPLDVLFENKRRWRERFHSSAPPPLQRVCVFCRNTGRSPQLFTSHTIRNDKGEVTCPVLLAKFCHKCGVKGHTANYCFTNSSSSSSNNNNKSIGSSSGYASQASNSSTSHASNAYKPRFNNGARQQFSGNQRRQAPVHSWR